MMIWLKGHLENSSYTKADKAVLWFGLMIAFFFMLRASEYLVQNRSWSEERVLHGEDVTLRKGTEEAQKVSEATEIVVHLKGSKTDQLNVGTTRNQYKTDEELCPGTACQQLFMEFRERFRGEEAKWPLMRWSSGKSVRREDIQRVLELAALAARRCPSEVGSHSLRIGGATAMCHSTNDLARVRRFGRWASYCFHNYVW